MKIAKAMLTLLAVMAVIGIQAQNAILTSSNSAVVQIEENKALAQAEIAPAALTISLDKESALQSSYKLNISSFGLINAEVATKYFNSISDNLVHYKPDFENNTVVVDLQIANLGEKKWSVEDWNTYLSERSARYSKYLEGINH